MIRMVTMMLMLTDDDGDEDGKTDNGRYCFSEGSRFDSPLRLTSLFKNCVLLTLSRDFALHINFNERNIKNWLTSLAHIY